MHPLKGEGDGVISSESELRGFAGKTFGERRVEQAGSRQLACGASEKAESTDTEVMERKLSETVRGSLLQSTVKTAGWRTRSEGRTDTADRAEIFFSNGLSCPPPKIFFLSIVIVLSSYPVT